MEIKAEIKYNAKGVLIKPSFEKKGNLFNGKEKEIYETIEKNKIIIHLGLGKKEEYSTQRLRNSISYLIRYIQKRPFKECCFELNQDITIKNLEKTLNIIIETLILAKHNNNLMKTKNKNVELLKKFIIQTNKKIDEKIIKKSFIISENVNWAKDLINLPSNVITPNNFVKEAKNKIKNVKFKVLDRKEIIKEKLNLIEAVSRSSFNEPKFMIIEYKPKDHINKRPICLIGKGITFDTGGVSLKPSSFPGNFIKGMKCDMAGAASTIAIINILSKLKSNKWVISLTPLCENTLGGNSYKVDDIITSHSGLNVEIINTDAEGRLILADALSYCKKYDPSLIVDIATLTGASLFAVGNRGACYMTDNQNLVKNIENSSIETDEKVWRLPLWEEYNELLKSDVADLINVNDSRGPGTIIGGLFLKNFVDKKTPWVHFDIGASAYVEKDLPLSKKGATGNCIRLLYQLIENYK